MERRNGYYDDIHTLSIYQDTIFWGIVIMGISMLAIFMIALAVNDDFKNQQEHNAQITEFNQKPFAERKIISDWIQYDVDEDYRLELEPLPTSFGEYMRVVVPIIILAAIVILPLATLYGYDQKKLSRYFLADIPLKTAWGRVLFFMLFTCWPILLISYIRMRRWEASNQPRILDRPAQQTDSTATDDLYTRQEDLTADRTHFAEDSREQYLDYCRSDNLKRYNNRVREAKNTVSSLEQQLKKTGNKVRQIQSDLKDAKSDLAKLETSGPGMERNENDLVADWKAIAAMRGVTTIYCKESKEDSDITLHIEVEVRVQYESETYDFGDYDIEIQPDRFRCKMLRSGVRDDWTAGNYPDYYMYDSQNFCFGARKGAIESYFKERRFREAVALIIDCLHSVNDDDEAMKIPQCFCRIIPPKEG